MTERGWLQLTVGLLAVVLGAVWTLHGLGALPHDKSVMAGARVWALIGPVVAVTGVVLIVVGLRRRAGGR